MGILTHIFYFLLVIFCFSYEIRKINEPFYWVEVLNNLKLDNVNSSDTITGSIYSILAIIGLFSSQWKGFLIILIISAIMSIKKMQKPVYIKIDAILTIIIVVYIVINKYHF